MDNHTSITLMCWEGYEECFGNEIFRDYARSLHLHHTGAKAISMMEHWYDKNPIEPHLSFEEVLQQRTSLREQTSWATLACWLAKQSEFRPKSLENRDREAPDQDDDSVD